MKEGKEKLEESAIIVQEVAKEIKQKDELLQKVAAKLVKTLYILDGKIDEKEALSEEHLELAEVSILLHSSFDVFNSRILDFCRWSSRKRVSW